MELPSNRGKAQEGPPTPNPEPLEQISGHDASAVTAPRSEALSIQAVRRARWAENGQSSWILKACSKDGGAALATIKEADIRFFIWSLADGRAGGWKPTKYGAQRAARRALREGNDHA